MHLRQGFAWMGLTVLGTKASTLLTQIALGYLLTPAEFGAIAFILGASSIASGFIESNIGKLLIKEQNRLNELYRGVLRLSAILACIGATIVAPYIVLAGESSDTVVAGCIICAFFPLNALAQVHKARVSIDARFNTITRVEVGVGLCICLTTVGCAALGLGVLSFGLGTAVGYMASYSAYRHAARFGKEILSRSQPTLMSLLAQTKWIIAATFLSGLALRGDYLVLSGQLSRQELGDYYFAFMLVANAGLIIAQGINTVLLPHFAKNSQDLGEKLVTSSALCFSAAATICVTYIFLAPPLVHFVWQGRWDNAATLSILFAATLPLKMLAPVSYSVLEAVGLWRRKFIVLAVDAISVLTVVWIAAVYQGLLAAVLALSLQRGAVGLFSYWFTGRSLPKTKKRRGNGCLLYLSIQATLLISAASTFQVGGLHGIPWWAIPTLLGAYGVIGLNLLLLWRPSKGRNLERLNKITS